MSEAAQCFIIVSTILTVGCGLLGLYLHSLGGI